jgi:fructokinase
MTTKANIVVGLGEVLWDCFADSKRPGGAPANVAFHARQLGHRGIICSRVGDDELGRGLLKYLTDREIVTRHIQTDTQRPTGTVTVDTTRPEAPSFIIHEDVAWDHLVFDQAVEGLMEKASAVCFGTLAQRHPDSRKTILRALDAARDALIVYDVNLRQPWYRKGWIEDSLRASDIVKLNEDEVDFLADLLSTGTKDPVDTARFFLERYFIELIVITRGGRGCLVVGSKGAIDQPGVSVDVADSVGAGDAFTAALISSRFRGWPLDVTAWFANKIGSLVAARTGAMPDLGDELLAVVADAERRVPTRLERHPHTEDKV